MGGRLRRLIARPGEHLEPALLGLAIGGRLLEARLDPATVGETAAHVVNVVAGLLSRGEKAGVGGTELAPDEVEEAFEVGRHRRTTCITS